MPVETKPIVLKASIDVESTPADLQPWDAQEKILQNTGIERDGGLTNLYTAVEANSVYEETLFTRNGLRVRLQRDDINQVFRVFTGTRDIGQVPQWAVEKREVLAVDANDVCATIDGTILVLRISTAIAAIQEINADTLELIKQRAFTIPGNVSDGFFVRNKAPTWASVKSIVGIFASGSVLNHEVITDGGTVYAIGNQVGFVNSSQVFAYYENGWIVSSTDETDPRTFLLNSAGVQQGTFTESTYLVANHNRIADTVSFVGFRDVTTLGTPATYGNRFTPPAAPLGVWVITALTNLAATPQALNMTFGGYALAYGAGPRSLFYANNTLSTRLWTIGHATPPEIYGYLDNGSDIAFKVHTILENAAYISASFAADGIGVPITEVGELNGAYYPQILKQTDGKYRLTYRRGNGSYATIVLTRGNEIDRMQEIAPGVVKINTTSAICIADANDNDLQYSGNAYNGFVVVGFNAVAPLAQRAFVARYRGDWGGSVDTNYKSTGAVLVGSVTLLEVPENLSFTPSNETIDVYVGLPPASIDYYRSVRDGIAQSVKSNLQGTIYVDDTIIPPPIGVDYAEQTIKLIGSTAIRELNYDGYRLLNEAIGQYDSFRLYGQLYLFDGDWIHSAQLAGNVLQQIDHVANALGLVLVAEAPTAVYFISSFDNSLYTFDGGQAVNKILRINRRTQIIFGTYNTRENTLALFGSDFVLWMRDGILSESPLPFVYPYTAFSTSDGIWIVKDDYAIKYVYNPITGGGGVIIALDLDGGLWGVVYPDNYAGGTWGVTYSEIIDGSVWGDGTGNIAPLVWQSKFNGFSDRMKQGIDRFMFRVYKPDGLACDILVGYTAYHENGIISESKTITAGDVAHPYDALGYAMIEFIPSNKNAIAASIKLSIDTKIILLDGFATVSTAGDSVVRNRA
jgi:hypothetical protein